MAEQNCTKVGDYSLNFYCFDPLYFSKGNILIQSTFAYLAHLRNFIQMVYTFFFYKNTAYKNVRLDKLKN